MSMNLDSAASARIGSKVRGAVWLVDMDFQSATLRYTNGPLDITTTTGLTYVAYNNLVGISALSESESNSAEKVTLSLSVIDQALLAASIGNVDAYRGRPVRLYLQLLDDRFQRDGAPVRRWSGYMDKVQISRQKSNDGPSSGKIEMICSRAGMARARTYQGRRLTSTQQQQRYPTDLGLQYLQNLVEQPARWLSKRFQEV